MQQTLLRSSLRCSLSDDMTQRQVEALAAQSAAAHASTSEQMKLAQQQQEELVRKAAGYS